MRRNSYQFAWNKSLVDLSEAGREVNSTRVPIGRINLNAVQRSRFAGFVGNLILENFERTKPTRRPKRGRRRLLAAGHLASTRCLVFRNASRLKLPDSCPREDKEI
jgi:hypothetical protein